ncbi:MAG: glycine cleavage system protein GcvH [Elusimicrobia bacterium]|nr:glycine cleavage system protein GcvH [Elusimicrobiota bacterium]
MPEPENCRYMKSHEWVWLDKETAWVGISEHAQKEITDVVFVDPPKPGRKVAHGQSCGVIESVKAAFDIYAPISGEVVAANQALSADPGLVNRSPQDQGWIFQIKPSQISELEKLMDWAQYQEYLKAPAHDGH